MRLTTWHANDRVLASLAVDAFLLARYCSPGHSPASGRAWQRAVSQLLWRPGFTRRQHAGVLGLFGRGSRSGARHEIDGVGQGPEIGAWIESKASITLDKSDVAVFHVKCFDLRRLSGARLVRDWSACGLVKSMVFPSAISYWVLWAWMSISVGRVAAGIARGALCGFSNGSS